MMRSVMPAALRRRIGGRVPPVRGEVVAITGGARGIGRATAEAFLDAGATVVIGDIDEELVLTTASELGIVGLPLDVADAASFEAFFDAAEAEHGRVDVLVNNAGIMPTGLFLEESPTMAARMVDVNIYGVLNGSRIAARRFMACGGGHLINVASLAGELSLPGLATYCGTKRFVIGFTDVLKQELRGTGVAVTTILPGVVRTELSAGTSVPRWLEAVTTVDPEQIAAAIVGARGGTQIAVPRRLGALITAQSLLSADARAALTRWLRLDRASLDTDAAIRGAYHRRIVEAGIVAPGAVEAGR